MLTAFSALIKSLKLGAKQENYNIPNQEVRVSQLSIQLSYKRLRGADYQRLFRKVKELSHYPNLLSNENGFISFTFLYNVK